MFRILVAEDSYAHQMRLEQALARIDCQWHWVPNGREALRVLPDFRPDLVISDVAMPVMSGLELYRCLRQRPDPPPVLFISAMRPEVLAPIQTSWEGSDWLTKPYTFEQLWAKLAPFGLKLRSELARLT